MAVVDPVDIIGVGMTVLLPVVRDRMQSATVIIIGGVDVRRRGNGRQNVLVQTSDG